MMQMLIVLLVFAVVILFSLLVNANRNCEAAEEREYRVRRAFHRLRDGEPLVGEDRYIVRTTLGDEIVDAILAGNLGRGVRHD